MLCLLLNFMRSLLVREQTKMHGGFKHPCHMNWPSKIYMSRSFFIYIWRHCGYVQQGYLFKGLFVLKLISWLTLTSKCCMFFKSFPTNAAETPSIKWRPTPTVCYRFLWNKVPASKLIQFAHYLLITHILSSCIMGCLHPFNSTKMRQNYVSWDAMS